MLDIGSILSAYKSNLPPNWLPENGLRSLFPSGYSGSISPLKNYVIFVYCQLAAQGLSEDAQGQTYESPSCIGNFWVAADGQGRWLFAGNLGVSNLNPAYLFQTGFVFLSAVQGQCLGCVDGSLQVPVATYNAGTDPRIASHWPQVLTRGVRIMFLSPSGVTSDIWTGAGFAKTDPPQLTAVNPPAQGGPSGSTLFPFPPTVPADALNPPGIFNNSGQGGGVGGYEGEGDSYSTQDDEDDPYLPVAGI